MPLVDQPFGATFTFARKGSATYRAFNGAVVSVPTDVPRFDHDWAGRPLGLLIEGRPDRWRPDRLAIKPGDWAVPGGTVLHAVLDDAGEIQRSAWYSAQDPVEAVNACLRMIGRHQLIAYVPGYIRNQDGWVRWRRYRYRLGRIIQASAATAIGASANAPLLEG